MDRSIAEFMIQAQTAGAIKFRRHYQRRRQGLVVIPVEVEETSVKQFLIASNFLKSDGEDRELLGKALSGLIDVIVKDKI